MYQGADCSHSLGVPPKGRRLSDRRFVLLQGPSSRFFLHLARALREEGAEVTRIGFCPGDRLYWAASAGQYLPYRGRLEAFGKWLQTVLRERRATDIIMLGDCRAPHAAAIDEIRQTKTSVRPWIIEHGYLRPNLILIEPGGMGGKSTIPERFQKVDAAYVARKPPDWPSNFLRYAAMDVGYHLSNVLVSPFSYPHHRAHSGIHPFMEYSGWVRKLAKTPSRVRERAAALSVISAHQGPLFLYPLQLSHDMQLLHYGTGEAQTETLDSIIASFQEKAPEDARLVVKVHPLDNGLTNWRHLLSKAGPRVTFLDGGDLDALLQNTTGVVTVNSTVGISALKADVPTLALGQAVYRRAGLTWEGPLDEFWQGAVGPPAERVRAFINFLAAEFHVPGAFDGPGAPLGARGLARWLARSSAGTLEETA